MKKILMLCLICYGCTTNNPVIYAKSADTITIQDTIIKKDTLHCTRIYGHFTDDNVTDYIDQWGNHAYQISFRYEHFNSMKVSITTGWIAIASNFNYGLEGVTILSDTAVGFEADTTDYSYARSSPYELWIQDY